VNSADVSTREALFWELAGQLLAEAREFTGG
jgi:hypothetical protein